MLKLISIFISFFLILIIFFRIPQEYVGLATITPKTSLLGSPQSTEHFLNILTGIGIVIYLVLAIQFNLVKR